ncbi:MAG: AmmeMemoRadiSam system protein B [Planctomycetota bacterium]|jgi:AmmeMemoRadiSam system protein B
MLTRIPIAQGFYPNVGGVCRVAAQRHLENGARICKQADVSKDKIVAGIVPHAGWLYSGDTAGAVFSCVSQLSKPDTFILLGSAHVAGVHKPALMKEGIWKMPLGDVEIDSDLAADILESMPDIVVENSQWHLSEHSMEVEVPFIIYLYPEARIVPVIVPPTDHAVALGQGLADLLKDCSDRIVVLGSSDLTHYGQRYAFKEHGTGQQALRWVKEENDKRVIDLCLRMAAEEIVPETLRNKNACGGGALAATVSYARALGVTEGTLLQYITSYDVEPEGEPSDFVGYAAMVF